MNLEWLAGVSPSGKSYVELLCGSVPYGGYWHESDGFRPYQCHKSRYYESDAKQFVLLHVISNAAILTMACNREMSELKKGGK